MSDYDNDPDVLAAKAFFEWWTNAKRRVRWVPLVTSITTIVVHWIIEANFLTFGAFGPRVNPPTTLNMAFHVSWIVTFLLGLFVIPRWQSVVAFLSIGYVILSINGR